MALAIGIGIGVSFAQAVGGTPTPTPTASITSLTIIGATPLPDGADAFVPNGDGMEIVLPDDGVSTFEPTKIELTVKDPGYDENGTLLLAGLGGPVRKVTGRLIFRKQWSNQAQRLNSASGGVRTVYCSLSGPIYAGSTVTAVAIEGYYGGAQAGAIGSVTNNSTRTYKKPTFAWLNAQHDRATGNSLYVEAEINHRWGMNGRMVACVKYQAKDAQGTPNASAEITVSAPTLSTLCKKGQPPECFAANVPMDGTGGGQALTNGDLCLLNAKVYPWLGDASAVLDLAVDGTATTGNWSDPALQTPLRFVCDRTGGYGGAIAYVRPTGTLTSTDAASGTAVFTTLQTGLTNAQCYASVSLAGQAIAAWNNTNKSHNDVGGGTIYLTDDGAGGAVAHTAIAHSRAAGKCYLDIKPDPNATGAVSIALSTTQVVSTLTRFVGVPINHSAGNGFDGQNAAGRIIAAEDLTIDQAGTAANLGTFYRNPLVTLRNVTVDNPKQNFWASFNGSDLVGLSLVLGCVVDTTATDCTIRRATAVIGCDFVRTSIEMLVDKFVISNTRFMKISDNTLKELGKTVPLTSFAIVQNIWEAARATNAGALLSISADGVALAMDGGVMMLNVLPDNGRTGRFNVGYTDSQDTGTGGANPGVVKRIHFRGNIFGQYDTKSDTFASGSQGGSATNTGRTQNWPIRYHVGDEANVVYSGNQSGDNAPDPDGGSWLGEQWNPSNIIHQAVTFVDNQSSEGGSGGGDYHLAGDVNGDNPAYDRFAGPATSGITLNGVAVSFGPRKYDLDGVVRFQDGTGAAGAYERTDSTPDAFSFAPLDDAELSTAYESDPVGLTGMNADAAFSAPDGLIVNGEDAGTSGTVPPNPTIKAKLTSSASYLTDATATVSVGGVSAPYVITTKADPTPTPTPAPSATVRDVLPGEPQYTVTANSNTLAGGFGKVMQQVLADQTVDGLPKKVQLAGGWGGRVFPTSNLNFPAQVDIVLADPADPPDLARLGIIGWNNVVMKGIPFKYDHVLAQQSGLMTDTGCELTLCTNFVWRDSLMSSDEGLGRLIYVYGGANIDIYRNTFDNGGDVALLMQQERNTSNRLDTARVLENAFTRFPNDCVRFLGVSNGLIEGNYMGASRNTFGQHADAIQISFDGTFKVSCPNLVIRNNFAVAELIDERMEGIMMTNGAAGNPHAPAVMEDNIVIGMEPNAFGGFGPISDAGSTLRRNKVYHVDFNDAQAASGLIFKSAVDVVQDSNKAPRTDFAGTNFTSDIGTVVDPSYNLGSIDAGALDTVAALKSAWLAANPNVRLAA